MDRPGRAVANAGFRPLAIAVKPIPSSQQSLTFADVEGGLILLGIVAIIDPPRDEVIEAIGQCVTAGIRVNMVTGDHVGTARAIASRIGIGSEGRSLTGDELSRLDPQAFAAAATEVDVFARVSPEHKLKLVIALQAADGVVAMTGNGVNDAPALKRADIGVALGVKGTEAAKEAAEIVLADDNFATIAHAVEEGRTVSDNIKKAILFILPTNGGEALTSVAAIALGRVLPVTAAQILWVNMVPAVALALVLAFEPPESDVMHRPPRDPREPMLTPFMWWRIGFVSLIMVAVTFGLFLWERETGASIEEARTVAVNAPVMLEIFYLFSTRFLYPGVPNRDGLLGNRYVLFAVGVVLLLQVLFTYAPPMWTFFQSRPLDAESWAHIVVMSSLVLLLVEMEKHFLRHRRADLSGQSPGSSRHEGVMHGRERVA